MKKVVWKGSFTLTATAILPEDATLKEVAKALAAQLDERLNLCYSTFWGDVQNIQEVVNVIE